MMNSPKRMKTTILTWGMVMVGLVCRAIAADEGNPPSKPLYANEFAQADLDKLPPDLTVLDGTWAVKEDGGNRFLELAGTPVDSFGVLFGPATADGTAVSLRAYATNLKRRTPAFGIGLNGAAGFRLVVSPGKTALELFKGEDRLASAPYTWESGTWTQVRLQVRKASADDWKVEGKAWKQGSPEPAAWLVSYTEKTAPSAGKATLWGYPFAGTPIRFDDLKVTSTAAAR